MIMKRQKRKLPPEDPEVSDRSSPVWESQRQFVFSVSLNKYQRGQELAEPSLRRSVLIANTLRQVSVEASMVPSADMEVSQQLPPCSSSPAPQESVCTEDAAAKHQSAALMFANGHPALSGCPLVTLNYLSNCAAGPPQPQSAPDVPPAHVKEEEEDWGAMSMDADFSLSAAISSILTALDSNMEHGGAQAAPRAPLRSLENLSGGSYEGGKHGVRGHVVNWEQQEESSSSSSSMEVMRSSYLSDLTVEDLFQDIDTSLLERDMGVLGLRGSGGYPSGDELLRHLPPFSSNPSPSFSSPSNPFSLSLNQKCLPSFSSFSPLSSSPSLSSGLSSQPFSAPSHAREGLELEHLMEILVES